MRQPSFSANLILIRSVWGINRPQLGQLLNCTGNQIAGYERGAMIIPATLLLALEIKTGIVPNRLYFEYLLRTEIPQYPFIESNSSTTPIQSILSPANTDDLSLVARVKRLELSVYGK
jgi:hypothetical protein